MAVLTGRSGQLFVDGARVARCAGWSLDEQRPMLDVTPVDSWDAEVIPGRRSATGQAKLLYDPADAAASTFFDSILLNGVSEVPITLLLDSATGAGYPVTAHVETASHAVARGEAQMRDISFRVSDVGIELEIIGSSSSSQGITQLYTGAVFGIDGAWSYLWTTSGPTIADPTAQSTNITFPDTGTFTITLTATLGLTVLTATKVVEVIETPLMWIARTTSAQNVAGTTLRGVAGIDTASQYVYAVQEIDPDTSVGPNGFLIHKYDYNGSRVTTKRISGFRDQSISGVNDVPGACQPLSNGDIFVTFNMSTSGVGTPFQWMRISADLSTIVYQFRMTGNSPSEWQAGYYDPDTERYYIFDQSQVDGVYNIGYVDLATGALTLFAITPTAGGTPVKGAGIKLSNGKILFASSQGDALKQFFVECNPDLRVGGIPAPTRVVEYTFSGGVGNDPIPLETANYIVTVGNGGILRFSKTDYTFISGRSTAPEGGGVVIGAYTTGSEIVLLTTGQGVYAHRYDEDLNFIGGNRLMPSLSTAPTYLDNAPNFISRPMPLDGGVSINSTFDAGLGLFAIHVSQKYTTEENNEMLLFGRTQYSSAAVLDYSIGRLVAQTSGEGATVTRTLSSTFDRSWTFADRALATTATSLTIANITDLTFESYVLTS